MNLIKLSTGFYPYTLAELQRDNPRVSFPSDLAGVDLAEYDAALVETDKPPKHDDKKEKLEPLAPKKVRGKWRVKWGVKPLTEKEIRERQPQDWDGFRDALLADSEFNHYYGLGMDKIPALTVNLLTDLNAMDYHRFSTQFDRFCRTVAVNLDRRLEWAELADSFYLPGDFVESIRGKA